MANGDGQLPIHVAQAAQNKEVIAFLKDAKLREVTKEFGWFLNRKVHLFG